MLSDLFQLKDYTALFLVDFLSTLVSLVHFGPRLVEGQGQLRDTLLEVTIVESQALYMLSEVVSFLSQRVNFKLKLFTKL